MNILAKIDKCEVCGSGDLSTVLDLGEHPLCDDLKPVDSNLSCENYPIRILFCDTCKTAHQECQVPKHELFPDSYHYRARFTKDVLSGMQELVNACEANNRSLVGKKVLDVGSNDGSLLNFFKEKGAICLGVEPTDAILDSPKSLDDLYNTFFDIDLAQKIYAKHGYMDVITFTNVFAHIEDLNGLLKALQVLIGENTQLIIENHYLGNVLAGNQFDTFYHEHPRTYSATSFKFIARNLGLGIQGIDFPRRYGGNIRVSMNKHATSIDQSFNEIFMLEENYRNQFVQLNEFIERWRADKRIEILALKNEHSAIYAKAFPARAAILIRMLDLDENVISGVFEQNASKKVGHFVPGTKIPIIQDAEMQDRKPSILINLAWHLKNEIEQYLRTSGFTGEIRHIL